MVCSPHGSLVPLSDPQARRLLLLFIRGEASQGDFDELQRLVQSCSLDELLDDVAEHCRCHADLLLC